MIPSFYDIKISKAGYTLTNPSSNEALQFLILGGFSLQ
jgi:hypothetical protein